MVIMNNEILFHLIKCEKWGNRSTDKYVAITSRRLNVKERTKMSFHVLKWQNY